MSAVWEWSLVQYWVTSHAVTFAPLLVCISHFSFELMKKWKNKKTTFSSPFDWNQRFLRNGWISTGRVEFIYFPFESFRPVIGSKRATIYEKYNVRLHCCTAVFAIDRFLIKNSSAYYGLAIFRNSRSFNLIKAMNYDYMLNWISSFRTFFIL